MEDVILKHSDISLILHLAQQEIVRVGEDMPAGSDLPKLYEKLLDICELED